ncbi:hypothetical protein COO60DRAFT_723196 [Scenedesmus sp. NREL 46B-D3]|nr:hypothetical protein COO60DRAFT_723196 [Scenedesmus sp. NREL 46B-D3]
MGAADVARGADTFKVEGRKHGADDGCGRWDEQVVFTAAVRVLFWKTLARTRVHQDIDASNPEHVRVSFRLLQSDLMSHLTGQWELQQLAAAGPGTPAVTKVTYTFEMWPKGVPSGLRFMPGLMEAVKGAVRREVAQLLDKVHYVASKVRPGVSVRDALLQVSAECNASGGSFKLLQQALTTTNSSSSSGSGSDVEFGTAAAAGAAAPTANTVQCHALVDDFEVDSEDADDDDMVELGSECYSDADGQETAAALQN